MQNHIQCSLWIRVAIACVAAGAGCQRSDLSVSGIELHPHVIRANVDAELSERSADEVKRAIERATDYLVTHHQSDGRFTYVTRPGDNDGDAVAPSYNLLRHAGAMYSLCQRYQWQDDERILNVVQEAANYLASTVAALPERPDTLAIWTTEELTGDAGPRLAKLGGTGLGLVALLSAESIAPGTVDAEQIRGLGEFLLFMRRPDGSFYSRFVPQSGGYDESWVSLYYPGEAALGFVHLYRWDGDRRWYDAALGSLLYLADTRDGQLSVPADHWALLATEQLLAIDTLSPLSADRQKLERHGRQICRVILNERNQTKPVLRGCFGADGRTTPTSTRVEGLTAALNFLPADSTELRQEIRSACAESVDFLIAAQHPDGELAGGVPQSIGKTSPPLTAAAKRQNLSAADVRVDYVQHAMSAWLQWLSQMETSD